MALVLYYPYTLTLQAPTIVGSLVGDPNGGVTLRYIPGSAIRGRAAEGVKDHDALGRLVLSGQVCYLNAYPVVKGRRSLPTPRTWRKEKGSDWWHDLAGGDDLPEEELEPGSVPFATYDTGDLEGVKVRITGRIHHQRDRVKGRAWKHKDKDTGAETEHGAIFFYESLDAGQVFGGLVAIRGENEEEIERVFGEVKEALGSGLLLGRSRRGGYGGRVRLDWGICRRREILAPAPKAQDGSRLRVILLSDYAGRDPETGQNDPAHLVKEIEQRLTEVQVDGQFCQFGLAGSFNRKWGMEIPQARVVRAGSVVVLKAERAVSEEAVRALEVEGIGERRGEGYGRVAVLEMGPPRFPLLPASRDEDVLRPAGDMPPLVRRSQERLLDEFLERQIAEVAAEVARNAKTIPPPSLLSRLRRAMRGKPGPALARLIEILTAEDEKKRLRRPAMDHLEACRIRGRESLAEWLETDMVEEEVPAGRLVERTRLADEATVERLLAEKHEAIRVKLIDTTLAMLALRRRSDSRRRAHGTAA